MRSDANPRLPRPRPGLEHFNRDWFHRRRFWIWGAVAVIVLLELLLVLWLLLPAAPGGLDGCLASPEGEPSGQDLAADFLVRINAFYQLNDRWPRNWGDARFTDLGLDPDAWSQLVAGVVWNPNRRPRK